MKKAYTVLSRPTATLRANVKKRYDYIRLKENCAPVYLTRGQVLDPAKVAMAEAERKRNSVSLSTAPQKAVVVNLNEVHAERRNSGGRRNYDRRGVYDRRTENKVVTFERRRGYERRLEARRLAEERRLSFSPEFPLDRVELSRRGTPENPARIFDPHHSLVTYLYKTEDGEHCIHVNFDNNQQKSEITAEDTPGKVRIRSNTSVNQLINISSDPKQPIYIIAEGETTLHINQNSKGHFKIGSSVF